VVLEEAEGIDQDLVPALGQDHDLEEEDPGLDRIQGVVLNPDQTREIALNRDRQEILRGEQETDLDPDRHPELKIPRDLRMETALHLEKEMHQDLVLDPAPFPISISK